VVNIFFPFFPFCVKKFLVSKIDLKTGDRISISKKLGLYVSLSFLVLLASGLWSIILFNEEFVLNKFLANGFFTIIVMWLAVVLTRHSTKKGWKKY